MSTALSFLVALIIVAAGAGCGGKEELAAEQAVENAVALEAVAQVALIAWQVNPQADAIPKYVLDKHYYRKHGPSAYYGQTGGKKS